MKTKRQNLTARDAKRSLKSKIPALSPIAATKVYAILRHADTRNGEQRDIEARKLFVVAPYTFGALSPEVPKLSQNRELRRSVSPHEAAVSNERDTEMRIPIKTSDFQCRPRSLQSALTRGTENFRCACTHSRLRFSVSPHEFSVCWEKVPKCESP